MAASTKDKDGFTIPHDDYDAIPDESYVIRYIHRNWLIPNSDGHIGVSSAAFSGSSKERDRYQGMSVDILELLVQDNVEIPSRMPPGHEGAVKIQVGKLRGLGLKVAPDPSRDQGPYHASVWGIGNSHRRKIKSICVFYILPKEI